MKDYEKPETPQELRIMNAFLKHHPQVAEAITVARTVVEKVRFPINSFQDLTDAMGGAQSAVEFGGRSFTLAELECQVPAYYFPIANENDLIAKMGDLSNRLPSVGTVPTLIPATAIRESLDPPKTSLEEIYKAASSIGRGVS